jgi:hypothetical protein
MRRREPTEWWAIDGGGFGYVLDLYPEEAVDDGDDDGDHARRFSRTRRNDA